MKMDVLLAQLLRADEEGNGENVEVPILDVQVH